MRTDWQKQEVTTIYETPFMELLYWAQTVHKEHFSPNAIQLCSLLSVKTGACPEDCKYCPQSGHYKTGLQKEKLMSLETVQQHAQAAKEQGSTRFCMGAAWRHLPDAALPQIIQMIQTVKALGLETCVTAGMLTPTQCDALKAAGLDFYNHNLDTSPEYYPKITSTRTYQDRLDTLKYVQEAGIQVCCGGIVGMGELREDRIGLLHQLATTSPHPGSVPINLLLAVPGTPLENTPTLDQFEFIRTVATARILMPKSMVRLSCGRDRMSDEMQAWCFFAGANSIFCGDTLLTTPNADVDADKSLFAKLNLHAMEQY